VRFAFAALLLVACGKPDRRDEPSGSGSSGSGVHTPPGDAMPPLPLTARCGGKWSGTIKWTRPACSDAVLANNGTFAFKIRALQSVWEVEIEKPEGTERRFEMTWDARTGHESCDAALEMIWSGAKPEHTVTTFTLRDGADGPTAHAQLHHTPRRGEECDAEGVATPTHERDDGLTPEPNDRYDVGSYKLDIKWLEDSRCDVGVVMPSTLEYRLDIDHARSDQLTAMGLRVPAGPLVVERIDSQNGPLQITAGVDVGSQRQLIVQTIEQLEPTVTGRVVFSVIDGDLVVCKRTGELAGKRRP